MQHKIVNLITIKQVRDKPFYLMEKALYHFHHKESLLILCPDDKALKFLDEFLWCGYPESFLPHGKEEWIYLSTSQKNFKTKSLFNLTQDIPDCSELTTIYDFEDLTTPEKQQASMKRYKAYKELGYEIACFS